MSEPDEFHFYLGNHPWTCADVVIRQSVYIGTKVRKMCEQFAGEKFFGVYAFLFTPPMLVVKDLKLLEHIMSR